MKSKFFQDEAKAQTYIVMEKMMGRQAYMLRYRAGTIEVRSWA